ncbi:hypothetical protein ACWEHA_34415 [Amycolatopsis nivea]
MWKTLDEISNIVALVAGGAYIIWSIIRRLRGTPMSTKRLLVLPVVCFAVGIYMAAGDVTKATTLDWELLGVFVLAAYGEGLGRGATIRLYEQDGLPHQKYNWLTVTIWLSLIPLRVGMVLLAQHWHADIAGGTDMVGILLGLTFLGEASVVLPRARRMGLNLSLSPKKNAKKDKASARVPHAG